MSVPTHLLETTSTPARIHEPGASISRAELQLASTNHAMPLEMLRHDLTPAGLHYVLVHYDIPTVDADAWRLSVDGLVRTPQEIDLAALRALPQRTVRVTLECAGNGRALLDPRPESQPWLTGAVGTAEWTGTPLAPLLRAAGIGDSAVDIVFTGADHGVERGVEQDYQRGLPLAEAMSEDALLAYEMNGAPLPPQHGYPVRLVVPGWYGMAHVKWLRRITVVGERFDGFQNAVAYQLKTEPDDPGRPVTRIEPRALIAPPGFPDFMSGTRYVPAGPVDLVGRAWSGHAAIERVEVSTDGGDSWSDATLGPDDGRWAWRAFSCTWEARPGTHSLAVRAHDASGRKQPASSAWNRGGFANNQIQTTEVIVYDATSRE